MHASIAVQWKYEEKLFVARILQPLKLRIEREPVLKPLDPKLELNIPPKAGEEDAPKALLPPPKAGVLLLPNGCAPKAGVD